MSSNDPQVVCCLYGICLALGFVSLCAEMRRLPNILINVPQMVSCDIQLSCLVLGKSWVWHRYEVSPTLRGKTNLCRAAVCVRLMK